MGLEIKIAIDMQKKKFLDFMLKHEAGISNEHTFSAWAEFVILNQPPCGKQNRCPCARAFEHDMISCQGNLFTKKVNDDNFNYLKFCDNFNKHAKGEHNG